MIDLPPELDTPEFHGAWLEWSQYRAKRKPALTPESISRQLKFLAGIGAERAIAAIDYSIRQGYQGVFEEKGNGQGKARSAGDMGRSRVGVSETAREQNAARRAAQQALDHDDADR